MMDAKAVAYRLIDLPRIIDERGNLTVGEFDRHIPFLPKRYFMVYQVPLVESRGEHAHRECHQFLICVRGRITVVIGDRVTIKNGVQLWDGLRVGDDVFIGPNVTFTNDSFRRSGNRNFVVLETVIENNVSIGAGAVLLPGLRVGAGAFVAAGSIVTKDVPAGKLVMGNPARVIEDVAYAS